MLKHNFPDISCGEHDKEGTALSEIHKTKHTYIYAVRERSILRNSFFYKNGDRFSKKFGFRTSELSVFAARKKKFCLKFKILRPLRAIIVVSKPAKIQTDLVNSSRETVLTATTLFEKSSFEIIITYCGEIGNFEFLDFILSTGTPVDDGDYQSQTTLHVYAALINKKGNKYFYVKAELMIKRHNNKSFWSFLSHYLTVNIYDGNAKTALHLEAIRYSPFIVEKILLRRVNLNFRDTSGKTPLFSAVKWSEAFK